MGTTSIAHSSIPPLRNGPEGKRSKLSYIYNITSRFIRKKKKRDLYFI